MRRIVAERTVAFGGWCALPSAISAEVVSAAGCDWMCIDQQHGLIDDGAMRVMVQAAAIRATPLVVRVPWNEPAEIMRAMDAGAAGVIVPMVNTAEEAAAAVSATRYPPKGVRSWGPVRSLLGQPDFDTRIGNEQAVCIVMIETVEALNNLDAILHVPDLDGVFVGPNDLRISVAAVQDGDDVPERTERLIESVGDAARRRGLAAGTTAGTAAEARRWRDAGFTLLSLPADAMLIGAALAEFLRGVREDPDA
jgi:4-hydroxy-2-oxoheptanedioate aldolase